MLKALCNLLIGSGDTGGLQQTDRVPMALAVLMLEVAYADGRMDTEELDHLIDSLRNRFELSGEAVNDLVELASASRADSVDLYAYTKEINWAFSQEEKEEIVEQLWDLVLADGVIDKYEEALMRQLADLIGLPHGRMIDAKLRAQQKIGDPRGR